MPSWTEPIGQRTALAEFARERATGRLNHAYLLEGAAGTGRMTLALAMVARILCHAPIQAPAPSSPTDEGADALEAEGASHGAGACGSCKSCRMLAQDAHPDVLILPRDVGSLRIRRFVEREGGGNEEIAHPPAVEFLHLKPVESNRRVCVIPDAERMENASANAFLKTLEEPPGENLVFLTTAARDRLLPTIVSRCRRVRVAPLPAETIREELLRRGAVASRDDARALATLSEGSLGLALSLTDAETLAHWRWLDRALEARTPAGAVRLGEGWVERLGAMGSKGADRYRDAIRVLDLAALQIRNRLREGLSPRAGAAGLEALWRAGEQLDAQVRPELALHGAALELVSALRRE